MERIWTTIFDAACFAVLVRFVLGWILANRSVARMLLMLLALSAVVFLLNRLDLPLTKWLTASLAVPAGLIIILGHFGDLRTAARNLSWDGWFVRRRREGGAPVRAVFSALREFARQRTGALLVLPVAQDVESHLSGGEEYDARVTKSLLLSIFNPEAPRHDGAAVIRDGRIVKVGAVLPLSTTGEADESWGTRHLAALGLAEVCDAVVLVVSEERGTVSMARNSVMRTMPEDEAEFESVLEAELGGRDRGGKTVWWTRPAAVMWAVALVIGLLAAPLSHWLRRNDQVFQEIQYVERTLEAPVYYLKISEDHYLEEASVSQTRAHVRLPADESNLILPNHGVSLDLSELRAGTHSIVLSGSMFYGLPTNWELLRYDPAEVRVKIGAVRVRRLPVEPRFGGLAQGLRVARTVVEPENVEVRIADNRPDRGRTIQTAVINLAEVKEPGEYSFRVALDPPPTVRRGGESPPERITVRVEVQ